MSNHHLRDKRLSLKSKGLLSVILSLPDDWDYTISGLAVICDTGKDMIRAAIVELEKAGYISRSQINQNGKFGGNQYTIREVPIDVPQPLTDFPTTVTPSTDIPSTDSPSTEKPTQIITNQPITDKSNTDEEAPTPPPAPRANKSKGKKTPDDLLDDGQLRNLLIVKTDELGKKFGLDRVQKNQVFRLASQWYGPRTIKKGYPPLHTALSVANLFGKLGRAPSFDILISVFTESLAEGYTNIHDERFKVGYQPPGPVSAPDDSNYRRL